VITVAAATNHFEIKINFGRALAGERVHASKK
jgi:hypothetical protein